MRSTRQARIGDTMYVPTAWNNQKEIQPLAGYETAKQMLFASVFPVDTLELESLFAAVDRLCLNDSSISVARDQSASLGKYHTVHIILTSILFIPFYFVSFFFYFFVRLWRCSPLFYLFFSSLFLHLLLFVTFLMTITTSYYFS